MEQNVRYELRPKSGTWITGADRRLSRFDVTVTHDGKPLGGNNIQLVVGAPGTTRRGLDEDVALWLDSGWWVSLRNEFERAPQVAHRVLDSASEELSAMTSDPRGADAAILGAAVIEATGPRHWV